MRKVDFEPIRLTEMADIFAIRIDNDQYTEFSKFLVMFKNTDNAFLKDDFERIIAAIEKIAENGALESFFRPEGGINDRVCAIPLLIKPRDKKKEATLRLYCIRVSDRLLILGGGGRKTTDAYDEDAFLAQQVKTLQSIDSSLLTLENNGISIENEIYNITLDID